MSLFLSIYLSIYPTIHLSIYISIHLSLANKIIIYDIVSDISHVQLILYITENIASL